MTHPHPPRRAVLAALGASLLPTLSHSADAPHAWRSSYTPYNGPLKAPLASGPLPVRGRWPAALQGTLYRIGPARRELGGVWPTPWWISAHTHAILVGFVLMMILGVALWMFPRPGRDDRHFDPRLAEAAYWLVAMGTLARRWVVVAGGTAQALGIGLFFWTMWTRIRGRPEAEPGAQG